jgi:hypothetical protein
MSALPQAAPARQWIHLDGEVDADPAETFDQASARLQECAEACGYWCMPSGRTRITVQTHERTCHLFYTDDGKLSSCVLGRNVIWERK